MEGTGFSAAGRGPSPAREMETSAQHKLSMQLGACHLVSSLNHSRILREVPHGFETFCGNMLYTPV